MQNGDYFDWVSNSQKLTNIMKNILKLIFIFLITNTVFSQSGTIIYDIKINFDLTKTPNDKVAFFTEIVGYATNEQFELTFNKSMSSFMRIKKLDNDVDYETKMKDIARGTFTSDSDVYIYYDQKKEIHKKSDGTLVENKYDETKWDITTESKTISTYLCYKAIQKIPFVNRKGENKIKEVTAWFTPSLPYSFGPKSFYGLPGLILELHENKTTYLASKIVLSDEEIKMDFPKGKIITKEVYDQKLKAQMGM